MLRYENYDREKDFTKDHHESNHKHRIFPLSEEGMNKYLKQAVFLREIPNPSIKNKELKIEAKNKFRYRNINPIYISNENKIFLKTEDLTENIDDNKISNEKRILRNYSYNKPKKNFEQNFRRNIKFKPKFKYFEPIIINKTLKNKFLIKGYHTKSKSYTKIKPKELPLIIYNKNLGKRKIEINEFNAFLLSSSLCNTITNHKSYYMGERYNPQNYQLENKNRTSRNEFGALFSN